MLPPDAFFESINERLHAAVSDGYNCFQAIIFPTKNCIHCSITFLSNFNDKSIEKFITTRFAIFQLRATLSCSFDVL
jgi:hypothetical protein